MTKRSNRSFTEPKLVPNRCQTTPNHANSDDPPHDPFPDLFSKRSSEMCGVCSGSRPRI
jgi:hypothetical protein